MVRAGLEDKGQTVSKDVRVEQKVSVALLASRDASCSGGGSEDETIADSREGEREHRLRQKMTCGGGMCCVRNHVEVKNEEEVIRGVQWSNQYIISGAVSCVNKVQLVA